MSSLPPMPSAAFHSIPLNEIEISFIPFCSPSLIEINYFQPNQEETITCLPNLPVVPESVLQIKLRRGLITRRFYFDEEDGHPRWDDEDTALPDSEHYVLNNQVSTLEQQLSQFMEQHTEQQVMSDVMQTLKSFAREAVHTVSHNDVIVRPFHMVIKFVEFKYYDPSGMNLVTSSEYDALVRIYEDSRATPIYEVYGIEKVRFYPNDICSEKTGGQTCSICLEDFESGIDLRRLPCSHVFHGDCIVEWLCTRPTCPMCRRDFPLL